MSGFGAYGKMPSLGDFFRIAPPPGFVRPWDKWVQSRLLDLRESLGQNWRNYYLRAPIWRFSLSSGVAGPENILGIMMPSVDRVGRDFPLTLMAAVKGDGTAFGIHAMAEDSFAALEDIALATLGGEVSLCSLTEELSDVVVPGASHTESLGHCPSYFALRTTSIAGTALLDAVAADWQVPTVWSTVLNNTRRIFVTEGLPGPERTRALFDLDAPLWRGGAALAGAPT